MNIPEAIKTIDNILEVENIKMSYNSIVNLGLIQSLLEELEEQGEKQ